MASDDPPGAIAHSILIRGRLQQIAEEEVPERQRRMAGALAFEWSRKDINLIWNETSRSNLHPAIRQVIFNMLWS